VGVVERSECLYCGRPCLTETLPDGNVSVRPLPPECSDFKRVAESMSLQKRRQAMTTRQKGSEA
jgi:hypothetical protein